jgi:iron complex transport system permease protein
MIRTKITFSLAFAALVSTILTAVAVGKYPIDLATLGRLVVDLFDVQRTGNLDAPALVLWTVRLPRILMAMLTGAALSVSGVVFQSLFKNPLVSPSILGVTAGANFGAALALLWFGGSATMLQASAFIWGLIAVILACQIGKRGDNSLTTLVLAGVIVSALFMAGLSYIKCKADPLGQLPAIVFWTMGSFTSVTWQDALWGAGLIVPGLLLSHFLRWGLNPILSRDCPKRHRGHRHPPRRLPGSWQRVRHAGHGRGPAGTANAGDCIRLLNAFDADRNGEHRRGTA